MRITKEYLDSLIENGRNTLKPDWNLWNPKKSDEGLGIQFQDLKKNYDDNDRIKLDIEGLNLISTISAYRQSTIDKIVKVDGDNKFVIYVTVVGKKVREIYA